MCKTLATGQLSSDMALTRYQPRSGRKSKRKNAANSDSYLTADGGDKTESDDELPLLSRPVLAASELPPKYWFVLKIVKYARFGTPTATLLALCGLSQLDFGSNIIQYALESSDAIDVLINVLEADDHKCKVASLRVLQQMTSALEHFRRAVVQKSGLTTLVRLLSEPNQEVRCLAAGTLAYAVRTHKSRTLTRKAGAVPLLVDLLDISGSSLFVDDGKSDQQKKMEAATAAAQALRSLSYSAEARRDLYFAGGVPLLTRLTGTGSQEPVTEVRNQKAKCSKTTVKPTSHEPIDYKLLTAVVGVIHQCSQDVSFRASVSAEVLLKQLLRHMRIAGCKEELLTLCSSTIAYFAEEEANRKILLKHKGPEILVYALKQSDHLAQQNLNLLMAISTAIWKLSYLPEGHDRLRQLNVPLLFIRHLNEPTEEVVLPIVSTLSILGTDSDSLMLLRIEGAVPRLVWLLSANHPELLSAAALTIANLTADYDSLRLLEKLDSARLLWSLLKHPSPSVQAGAASAIAAFSERSKSSGAVARSLVGGLELLVSLLRAPELTVVTAAASAVARMAVEDETLAVLSDHHVVSLLAGLVKSKSLDLKLRVAEAIAECCRWPGNPAELGEAGGVKPLIKYLLSNNVDLRRAAAKALNQVSSDRENCMTLHKNGAIPLLLGLVGCGDMEIQAAAAGCLGNIRQHIHS